MPHCEHDYKYGPAADTKAVLLKNVTAIGKTGLWIKPSEMDFAGELVTEGKIVMCSTCERSATLV